MTTNRIIRLCTTLVFSLAFVASYSQERYDIVIANGRVMDPETGLNAIRDVGIIGQSVVAISEAPLQGDTEVDATGLIVSPGFVDCMRMGRVHAPTSSRRWTA